MSDRLHLSELDGCLSHPVQGQPVSGHLSGAGPQAPTLTAHLEGPSAVHMLLLVPLSTAHERVIAGIPEARHEIVALGVSFHFKLRHGGLHLSSQGEKLSA